MKKILRQIMHWIRNFFNRIIDNEARRVFDFTGRYLGPRLKGGERLKSFFLGIGSAY